MGTAKILDEKSGNVIEYYVEDRLKRSLDNKVIPSLHTKDKDFVICIDGREGCLSSDTLIKTSKGDIKIKDLCNGKEFMVKSLDIKENKIKDSKAICIKSGSKELFEIETDDGRKIKATSNHTFFILRNSKVYEIELSKLRVGDKLICQ
jgi:hypothetical protein